MAEKQQACLTASHVFTSTHTETTCTVKHPAGILVVNPVKWRFWGENSKMSEFKHLSCFYDRPWTKYSSHVIWDSFIHIWNTFLSDYRLLSSRFGVYLLVSVETWPLSLWFCWPTVCFSWNAQLHIYSFKNTMKAKDWVWNSSPLKFGLHRGAACWRTTSLNLINQHEVRKLLLLSEGEASLITFPLECLCHTGSRKQEAGTAWCFLTWSCSALLVYHQLLILWSICVSEWN